MPTFDGENLLITLDATTPTVDVQVDLYSDWKEYFKTGTNSRFPKAFAPSAGGQTTIPGEVSGRNFFLRNDLGWRIRPAEENAEINLVGNLFKFDATLPMIIPTLGAFTVLVNIQRSSLALVEQVGGSGLTAAESLTLAKIDTMEDIARNRYVINRVTNRLEIFNKASSALLFSIPLFEDADGTLPVGPTSTVIDRRDRIE